MEQAHCSMLLHLQIIHSWEKEDNHVKWISVRSYLIFPAKKILFTKILKNTSDIPQVISESRERKENRIEGEQIYGQNP